MVPFARDTVIVVAQPVKSKDRHNNFVRDWDLAERSEPIRASVQFTSSSENKSQSDQLINYFRCFLPPSTEVTAYDRIIWNDVTYEVDGRPEVRRSGLLTDHVAVTLKEMTG